MRTKIFDCVRMKDKIQEEIYQDIKDLPPAEQIAYYQKAIQAFAQLSEKFARIQRAKTT
ncbi:MAG: hypothetical protein HY922_10500 [Elusimicrobia bacterium]|nr:hypothetical protein [Elusimicrobiota bacterium]